MLVKREWRADGLKTRGFFVVGGFLFGQLNDSQKLRFGDAVNGHGLSFARIKAAKENWFVHG